VPPRKVGLEYGNYGTLVQKGTALARGLTVNYRISIQPHFEFYKQRRLGPCHFGLGWECVTYTYYSTGCLQPYAGIDGYNQVFYLQRHEEQAYFLVKAVIELTFSTRQSRGEPIMTDVPVG
jgi:hypothetical protein